VRVEVVGGRLGSGQTAGSASRSSSSRPTVRGNKPGASLQPQPESFRGCGSGELRPRSAVTSCWLRSLPSRLVESLLFLPDLVTGREPGRAALRRRLKGWLSSSSALPSGARGLWKALTRQSQAPAEPQLHLPLNPRYQPHRSSSLRKPLTHSPLNPRPSHHPSQVSFHQTIPSSHALVPFVGLEAQPSAWPSQLTSAFC
jgi:hypothetical protein